MTRAFERALGVFAERRSNADVSQPAVRRHTHRRASASRLHSLDCV